MSSAVNKSQKRFMPKASAQGPGGRAPARRLSTLRTSFSIPVPAELMLNKRQPAQTESRSLNSAAAKLEVPSRAEQLGLSKGRGSVKNEESDFDDSAAAASLTAQPSLNSPSRTSPSGVSGIRTGESVSCSRASLQSPIAFKSSKVANLPSSRASKLSSLPSHSPAHAKPTEAHRSADPEGILTPESSAGSSLSQESTILVEQTKPQAPPGCEVIWPEDLPDLRASERRRKMTFERELLSMMRRLFAEKEKSKLLESSENMNEEEADILAHEAADRATYHQLKQAVGNEAKTLKEEEMVRMNNQTSRTLLDVNKFTMAALCRDIPAGMRNDSFDDYELARVNRRRDTVRVFRAKLWSRKMYEPRQDEKMSLQEAFKKHQDDKKQRTGRLKDEQKQKFTEIDDAISASSEEHAQASIEIQANGDISLVGTQFDRHKNNRSQREGSTEHKTEVDPTEQIINSYSFSTRERPDRWTKDETTKFYEAISALGTDFNLISHLFPMRSRNQIKTKYKYEEKRNPAKLQMHLVARRKFNVDSYSLVSNVPIEEVTAIENELEQVRREHTEQMKLEEASRVQAKEEDLKRKFSKRAASSEATGKPQPKRERAE